MSRPPISPFFFFSNFYRFPPQDTRFRVYALRSRVSGVYTTPPFEVHPSRRHRHIRRICASPFTFFVSFPAWHRRPSPFPPLATSLLLTYHHVTPFSRPTLWSRYPKCCTNGTEPHKNHVTKVAHVKRRERKREKDIVVN